MCWIFATDIKLSDGKEAVYAKRAVKAGYDVEYPFTEQKYLSPPVLRKTDQRPVVVGFGPAGIFIALTLAKNGFRPIIVERGGDIDERAKLVDVFNKTGILDENTNIQFGEGGAGAFSDGKLTTLIKDKDLKCRYILETFVSHGAPEEIMYEAHPHVGTDKLRKVIKSIRNEITASGGEFKFNHRFTGYDADEEKVCAALIEGPEGAEKIETDSVFLAIGHSSRDTFETLYKNGIPMERKPFSVGVRIEHLQKDINFGRYRSKTDGYGLPPADYKLAVHTGNGRILYTFCMCPGGSVVAAASEAGGVVTNGMSVHARDGENANSALLVSVEQGDFKSTDPLAGIYFQRELERKAFLYGGGEYRAPAQTVGDFIRGVPTASFGGVVPTYPRGVAGVDLKDILPEFLYETLKLGIPMMENQLPGFASGDAVLTGVESRSTCPVRIIRDKETFCTKIKGLYPAGEGAGYAGGIMSAAADGMKVAEAWLKSEI